MSDVDDLKKQIQTAKDKPTEVKSPVLMRPIVLGDLTLASPTTQTTVGAAGGASALPATPLGYVLINMGTVTVAMPYYTAS